ncbi:MAG: family 10 glycosylhydrolase [Bacilli bacterium]|nr:family 10 glycosylhydrolase [Bacilli bacterium]
MKLFNKFSKILLIVLISVLFLGNGAQKKKVDAASTYEEKVQEYRAVWVSHFVGDIASYKNETQYKAEVDKLIAQLVEWNMNAMVFHVRTHNNALYNSKLNPLARWWDGVDFDTFDPLHYIIEQCHANGIEFHAWMNPYRITTTGTYPMNSNETTFPEGNPANDPSNFITVGNNIILDPGIPENRDFIVDTCMELVENYDVDAIHFDDYFYISGADDTATRNKYNTDGLSLGDFRRKQVDLFIEQLHNAISKYNSENNKAIEIGISPSGVYRNEGYSSSTIPQYDANGSLTYPLGSNTAGFAHYDNYLYSDTKYWIDQEWIDYITPQTYHATDNPSSPFGNLVEWWNWVVKNKKVNLSFGIGIYMTLGNDGGWDTPDEFEKQMLLENQAEYSKGLCLYKYASLFSTSANMVSHVNAMKSNWTKNIPSAIKPQHTNLPEPVVENLNINGNLISWDKLDNVRGYIVWQVKKGSFVDTTNISHLYDYIQSTSIEVEDGYDYYVSSVNLANEISKPVLASSLSETEQLVVAFNSIKFPVTINDESYFNSLKARYDALTESDKAKVSNYILLETAFEQLETIKSLSTDVEVFKQTLKTEVLDKYLLPLLYEGYSISWEYVDSSDANLFDIETGEVLVEYLATTIVELKYTMSKNGVSISGTHNFNIGYIKQSETGLIYRNTPNALNKLEDPTANANFIGWAGVALKFSLNGIDYVYYPAEGNYHDLTSSEIPESKWPSCGFIFRNVSSSSIIASGEDFVVNEGNGYGYFIVGSDGLVNYCVSSASYSDSITLKPGEMIFIPNYLNSKMTDPILRCGTNIPVGTKIELVTVKWSEEDTNESLAQEIIDQIELIGNNITLDSKDQVERAEKLYAAASPTVQAMVTNYDKLVIIRGILDELIERNKEIETAKQNAKNTIANYLDRALYSDTNQATIESLISSFNSLVETKDTTSSINELVNEYKIKLDAVKTIKEEEAEIIIDFRKDAIEELKLINKDIDLYSKENQGKINAIISEYEILINKAETTVEVLELTATASGLLKAIPTILDEAKSNALKDIEAYYAGIDFTNYSSTNSSKIRVLIASAKAKINTAVTVEAINELVTNLKKDVEAVETISSANAELENAKKDAIASIKNYKNLDEYSDSQKEKIETIIEEYTTKINASTTVENVNSLKEEAYLKMDEFEADPFEKLREEAYRKAVNYAEEKGIEKGNNQLTTLLEELEKDLEKAKTSTKIDELLDEFKMECDKLVDKKPGTISCLNATYISSIIMILSLSFILISKKRH